MYTAVIFRQAVGGSRPAEAAGLYVGNGRQQLRRDMARLVGSPLGKA